MSASQAPVGTPAQNYTYNGKELQVLRCRLAVMSWDWGGWMELALSDRRKSKGGEDV
jgi:hypothetical protein